MCWAPADAVPATANGNIADAGTDPQGT
jgi:hypothetical protein